MKNSMAGRAAGTLVRVAVSVAVLVLLFRQVDSDQVVDHLRGLSPLFLLFAAAYYAGCQLLSSYRWQLFLVAKGISIPLTNLFSFYLMGMFWSRFLPGAVGGDAARAYQVYQRSGQGNVALSSVFLERFAGLLGLALLAVCALVLGIHRLPRPVTLITVGSIVFLLSIILLLWWKPLFTRMHGLLGRLLPAWFAGRVQALYGALSSYRNHPGTLVRATLLSVAIQALYALYFGVVAWGLGIEIDVYYFILFQPPVTLAMLAPISLGGLGVREAAMIVLFREVGVAAADVLAVSLTAFLLTLPLSLWGGLLLVWQRRTSNVPRTGELSGG